MDVKAQTFDRVSYNPKTGVFTWLKKVGRGNKGNIAGHINKHGYLQIQCDRKKYQAHRIAWFMTYGKWPDGDIDHINGVRTDNRIENLRDVSRSNNLKNQRKPKANNKSGFLGVYWHKGDSKWIAKIKINGKNKHLGSFENPAIAHTAYLTAKRESHEGCTI
jgi:hypothetical protein